MASNSKEALVIGGGIAGIQAALDLADMGIKVQMIEKKPCIGGRMAQLDKTFPTNDCSICILAPKLSECGRHPNITIHSLSEVQKVNGSAGNFSVDVLKYARFVKEDACINCGTCYNKCPTKVDDEFDRFLRKRKAIYMYYLQGIPAIPAIDKDNCLYLKKGACKLCQKNCDKDAIDFEMKDEVITLNNIGSIIAAPGYDMIEDADPLGRYGYKKYRNVVSALEFERLFCLGTPGGPLAQAIRWRNPKENSIFAMYRLEGCKDHDYCSAICCMYTTKEAMIAYEHDNELKSYVFYIDMRAGGKGFQKFLTRGEEEYNIDYIKSKVSEIKIDANENPIIVYEDYQTSELKEMPVDMAVLATCIVPPEGIKELAGALDIELDKHEFIKTDPFCTIKTSKAGIFTCGCAHEPMDIPRSVAEASSAAARAAEVIRGAD